MRGNACMEGSVTLGEGVVIGRSASIKDHITIHPGAKVVAGSVVISNVAAWKIVDGYPDCDSREKNERIVALRKLARNEVFNS